MGIFDVHFELFLVCPRNVWIAKYSNGPYDYLTSEGSDLLMRPCPLIRDFAVSRYGEHRLNLCLKHAASALMRPRGSRDWFEYFLGAHVIGTFLYRTVHCYYMVLLRNSWWSAPTTFIIIKLFLFYHTTDFLLNVDAHIALVCNSWEMPKTFPTDFPWYCCHIL